MTTKKIRKTSGQPRVGRSELRRSISGVDGRYKTRIVPAGRDREDRRISGRSRNDIDKWSEL